MFRDCLGIDDDEILNKGVGQVEGSSLRLGGESTHSVLAARRGMGTKGMFRNVDELHAGDVFLIHGNIGTLKYEVTAQRVVIYPHETISLNIEEGCRPYNVSPVSL